jgi:hypothetical protein
MGVEAAIWLNVLIILVVFLGMFILGALLDDGLEGCVAGFGAAWVTFWLSVLGWAIYIIAHFVAKYW